MNIVYSKSIQIATYYKEEAAIAELKSMGLNTDIFNDALAYGWNFRINSQEAFDVPLFGGTSQWAKSTSRLRFLLSSIGWQSDDDKNLSKIVSPNKEIAIIVSSGNAGTGKEGVPVTTKNPKGELLETIINSNLEGIQKKLFPNVQEIIKKDFDIKAIWYLLYFNDENKNEIRSELSLPIQIENNGKINKWAKRILLSPVNVDPTPLNNYKQEFNDDIQIDISRKAN